MSARHRAKSPWFRSVHGRANQPAARHTPEYIAGQNAARPGQPNVDGWYPMGQPFRVPRDPDALAEDLDRGNNDPHTRVTLQEAAQ
jgi:hypothetical protein